MKRKLLNPAVFLLIFFIFLLGQTSQSQILISLLLGDKLNSGKMEFGVDGGYNRSFLSGLNNAKGLNNFHLGFYFDFRLKDNWLLNTGVRVKSNVGSTKLDVYEMGNEDLDSVMANGHITRRIGYFYVPVHIKYKFGRDFFINAGFQVGLRNKARDELYNSVFEKDDVVFTHDIGDYVTRLDFGLSGGLGYKFKGTGMSLGITYYHGLVDVMKDSDLSQYNTTSYNSSLYIYVYIPVGAGYKEEKRAQQE